MKQITDIQILDLLDDQGYLTLRDNVNNYRED